MFYFIDWHIMEVNAMNGENIKRRESKLVRAYKEGHYEDALIKMVTKKPSVFKSIAHILVSIH
ncbi:MAG: hypothetical protein IKW81_05570 [Pseudobutyrivibrio sp.]|nr:hypothetical protein [Pseudobutyrivibrio sp.]